MNTILRKFYTKVINKNFLLMEVVSNMENDEIFNVNALIQTLKHFS